MLFTQKLEEAGKITSIEATLKNLWREKFEERFDTASAGRSVRIRHPPTLHEEIDYIVFKCKQEQRMRNEQRSSEQRSKSEQQRQQPFRRWYNYIDRLNYPDTTRTALKAAVVIYYSNMT